MQYKNELKGYNIEETVKNTNINIEEVTTKMQSGASMEREHHCFCYLADMFYNESGPELTVVTCITAEHLEFRELALKLCNRDIES